LAAASLLFLNIKTCADYSFFLSHFSSIIRSACSPRLASSSRKFHLLFSTYSHSVHHFCSFCIMTALSDKAPTSQLAMDSADDPLKEDRYSALYPPENIFDVSGRGLRWDTAADVQQFCEQIAKYERLEVVRLSGNTLGVEAARAFAAAFATQKYIKVS
jgi:hypothetical protein